jgi:phosphoglycerate dehydrogenase-like enzyme
MNIGYLGMNSSLGLEMVTRLRAECPDDTFVEWPPEKADQASDLDVLLAVGPVEPELFSAQAKLGLLQMVSAGYDGVDVEAATEAGVWVASAPTGKTGNGESVAEHAVLLMLAAARRLNEELAFSRARAENRPEQPQGNKALFGKTVCIVGLGGIGALLAERLRGFGMVLTGVDLHPEHAPAGVKAYGEHALREALADADFVVLALPATKTNENMFDAGVLASMKEHAILVNVARGKLVDEAALLAAVKSGHLYGAGLDVAKDEPVSAGNPLLSEPRIVVTPHIAGSTDLMLDGSVKFLGEVLANYRKGLKSAGVLNEPKRPRVELR